MEIVREGGLVPLLALLHNAKEHRREHAAAILHNIAMHKSPLLRHAWLPLFEDAHKREKGLSAKWYLKKILDHMKKHKN